MSDATKIIAFERVDKAVRDLKSWPGLAGYPRFERAFAPTIPAPSLHAMQSVPANDVRPSDDLLLGG